MILCIFLVTSDANWESKIDHAQKVLNLREVFEGRDYRNGFCRESPSFSVCRDPNLNFTQRIRFTKKDKRFAMDIMLSLPWRCSRSNMPSGVQIMAERLMSEVMERLRRYKFRDFDYAAFEVDRRKAITEQMLGPDAARFDHLCKPQATI